MPFRLAKNHQRNNRPSFCFLFLHRHLLLAFPPLGRWPPNAWVCCRTNCGATNNRNEPVAKRVTNVTNP
jgi:hypothetical protein